MKWPLPSFYPLSENVFYLKMGLEFELIKALIVFDSGADLMLTYLNNEMQIAIFPGILSRMVSNW